MAGLIKNQILKHLSKFAKNVSSDSVNVSTLKGEGELTNLELNEAVLTDLLELPTWLRITRARVNKVSLKIQWTKLKSVPIVVSLDEVQVEMETCTELRSQGGQSVLPSYSSGGRYGFSDKVIDGMTVTVNSVLITFRSPAFHASFQLSRIVLDSKNPFWLKADLRTTRLKDVDRGEVLIFKELSWQTLRIEARSTRDQTLTPLRLITNQARCRITIKKKLADCSVVGCRLVLLMDDVLWVLTDSQLTAAFHFLDSLSDLIRQATQQSQKTKAIRKLESLPEFQAQQTQHVGGSGAQQRGAKVSSGRWAPQAQTNLTKAFNKYDVPETSYHFYSERIDLHFCDDPGPGRSGHPDLSTGAALQVALCQLELDFYPYHLAAGDRGHWIKYCVDCGPALWAQAALAQFKTLLTDTLNSSRSTHTPLSRAPPHTRHDASYQTPGGRTGPGESGGATQGSPLKCVVATQLRQLMSSCCVLRINDYCVYRVSTSKRKQAPKEFISGDKERFKLPTQMASLHLEFTTYYYPADSEFPVPPPKLYLQLNPLQVTFDPLSILWINSFARSLQRATVTEPSPSSYLDVHLEAIMPRAVIDGVGEHSNQRDRPHAMHIQASRVILSNMRPADPTLPGSLASLATSLEAAQQGELFFASTFPASSTDFQPICHKFVKHAMGEDNVRAAPVVESGLYEAISGMKRDALWIQARDILFIHCEPLWVDFFGVPAARNRPVPFVDAFPLSLWIYIKPKSSLSVTSRKSSVESCEDKDLRPHRHLLKNYYSEDSNKGCSGEDKTQSTHGPGDKGEGSRQEAATHILAHTPSLVSAQLNHYQYLFLMRQLDVITELTSYLTYDTINILTHPTMAGVALTQENLGDTIVVSAVVPQVDVSLVMPPPHPSKDFIAGDMESFLPDSSSTADLHDLGSPSCEVRNSASEHSFVQKASEIDACSITSDITKSYSVDQLTSPQPVPASTSITRQPSNAANGNINQPPVSQHSPVSTGKQQSPSPAVKHAAIRQLSISLTDLPCSGQIFDVEDSHVNGPLMQLNLQGNLNAGFISMRKGLTSGFTNLMSTLESAVKTSPEDMSDTLSVRSDLSSESDNFVLVNIESERTDSGLGGMDALFRVENKPPPSSVELASEVFEEPTPSEISDVTSSFRRKDSISVVTFKMSRMQIVQESRGYESTVKVQCCHLVCEECSTMGYDEFQTKFSSRCRGWSDSLAATDPCCLKIRLDTHVEPTSPGAEEPRGISGAPLPVLIKPFLEGHVADLNMSLLMSTITGLVDLIEDEVMPQPFPMEILMERIGLQLTEDRIPANITSPGSVPTVVWLPRLIVKRDNDGVFTLLPQSEESCEAQLIKDERDRLKEELNRVRQQLASAQEANRSLQEEVTKLNENKSTLGFSLPKFPLP
ncbi:bridge-like lipid transfer protein family member 3B isoform X2 [Procambarus clarkii]|uniref:bridge-like lipid transfer protein family member 3B isoform X2 n=1 Tax=Procambarus clarkii TaxID=6728 RepID=UPI001E6714C2|nr:UHRF1-binding protein 1-like isoform X2 [Procambarus clarkii]